MEITRLLAVIEVPRTDRVLCTAEGCGHFVYKRVHLIREEGQLKIYGSTCFARKFQGQEIEKSKPKLTSTAGRLLTESERYLLLSNTERLLKKFEEELALEQESRRAKTLENSAIRKNWENFASAPRAKPRLPQFTPEERASAEPEARRLLNEKYEDIDFDSHGFTGILQIEIERILRGRKV
jgi:hypothetical protein